MKNLFTRYHLRLALWLLAGVFLGWLLFRGSPSAPGEGPAGLEAASTTWTCSMHPQIRQSEPGSCPICGMDLITVAARGQAGSDDGDALFVYRMSPEAAALATLQTTAVRREQPMHELVLSGKIVPNEEKRFAVTAQFSGRIERLFVNYPGQQVRKGQRIAAIYSPELVGAQQELLQAARYRETNPLLYEAAREKLRLWQIPEAQIEAIEASGAVQNELIVYAPAAGTVMSLGIATGDFVSRGTVLFELADLRTVWLALDAYEADLAWLATGQRVDFSLAALPGRTFNATVTFVSPVLDPLHRTATVRAEAPNADGVLKPEMFVDARLSATRPGTDTALWIPRSAVLWTGPRSVVFVATGGDQAPSHFEMREVLLGAAAADQQMVESGLQHGERVVSSGAFAVDAAAQLSGNYSMMNRPRSTRLPVPDAFKSQLTRLTHAYFSVKNALVESDSSAAATHAAGMQRALDSVDMQLLTDHQAHEEWMTHQGELEETLALFRQAEDIEPQRTHFRPLSNTLIEVVERFGVQIEVVYVAWCPMALDNTGAYWLSEFEEIKNPYFGDAMLVCGEVRRRIRALDSYREAAPPAAPPAGHEHHNH